MNVSVTVTFTAPAGEKHRRQMQRTATRLSHAKDSVRIIAIESNPAKLTVRFTIPDARQEDVVDSVGRPFMDIEDYADSSIGFSSEPRRRSFR